MLRVVGWWLLSFYLSLALAVPLSYFVQIPPLKIMGFVAYVRYFPRTLYAGWEFGSQWIYVATVCGVWGLCLGWQVFRARQKKR